MKIFVRPSQASERWPGHPEELWFAWADGNAAGCLGDTPERAVNKVLVASPAWTGKVSIELLTVRESPIMRAARNERVHAAYNARPPYTEEDLRR